MFGPVVWYVDIDAAAPPAGQGGRSHSPFNSLAPLTTGGTADRLDGDGDIIFVGVDSAAPIAAYDGGIVLETNQRLWGEPFGLTVDPGGAVAGTPPSTILVAATPATPATGNPNIRNTAAGGVGITLANGVDVQRVNAGVTGTASTTGISGTAITTATIGPNQLVQGNTTGVSLTGAAGGNITVAADDQRQHRHRRQRRQPHQRHRHLQRRHHRQRRQRRRSPSPATPAPPSTSPARSTSPAAAAAITTFSASGGGTITATNAANQITSFTGTGINLNGVTIGAAGVTFNTVSSAAGGAANGILLTNVAGPGAFTVNGGAITATTRALDVDDNSANVTIGATLTTSGTAARSVEVTNRDGGTVDINGLVTDTSQGINLTDQRHRPRPLRRRHQRLHRRQHRLQRHRRRHHRRHRHQRRDAPNNTLTTTTGTALNVTDTTIHADDLTFRSISANGASERHRAQQHGSGCGPDGDRERRDVLAATPTCTGGTIRTRPAPTS